MNTDVCVPSSLLQKSRIPYFGYFLLVMLVLLTYDDVAYTVCLSLSVMLLYYDPTHAFPTMSSFLSVRRRPRCSHISPTVPSTRISSCLFPHLTLLLWPVAFLELVSAVVVAPLHSLAAVFPPVCWVSPPLSPLLVCPSLCNVPLHSTPTILHSTVIAWPLMCEKRW